MWNVILIFNCISNERSWITLTAQSFLGTLRYLCAGFRIALPKLLDWADFCYLRSFVHEDGSQDSSCKSERKILEASVDVSHTLLPVHFIDLRCRPFSFPTAPSKHAHYFQQLLLCSNPWSDNFDDSRMKYTLFQVINLLQQNQDKWKWGRKSVPFFCYSISSNQPKKLVVKIVLLFWSW